MLSLRLRTAACTSYRFFLFSFDRPHLAPRRNCLYNAFDSPMLLADTLHSGNLMGKKKKTKTNHCKEITVARAHLRNLGLGRRFHVGRLEAKREIGDAWWVTCFAHRSRHTHRHWSADWRRCSPSFLSHHKSGLDTAAVKTLLSSLLTFDGQDVTAGQKCCRNIAFFFVNVCYLPCW